MKRYVLAIIGERWRRRLHALGRLRWITKYRLLRRNGVSPWHNVRYLLFDPEIESFTFRVGNLDEMLAAIAELTGTPVSRLAEIAAEPDADPTFGDRLARGLRWRLDVKHRPQLGNRLGWYVLVRALGPELVIETGTYHGLGSLTLLRALDRNREHGVLGRPISFDRTADAGWMVDRHEYPEWQVVLGPTQETLASALGERKVGALFHDTDHTEENRRLEFGLALAHAAPELLLVDSGAGRYPTLARLAEEHGGSYRRVPLRAADHSNTRSRSPCFASSPGAPLSGRRRRVACSGMPEGLAQGGGSDAEGR